MGREREVGDGREQEGWWLWGGWSFLGRTSVTQKLWYKQEGAL